MTGTLLFYFGYPISSDNDGRLCARTALEISSQISKRNALLKQSQGVETEIRMGMNTGFVTIYADAMPEGETANIAAELAKLAEHNQILSIASSKLLLDAYLDFQPQKKHSVGLNKQPQQLYSLVAERHVEAFGFLRGNKNSHALIGRDQEFNDLCALISLESKITGNKCVHLYGEAGIGKSRLIFECRQHAKGFNHYVAQCLPEHKNNALYPILAVIKQKYALNGIEPAEAVKILTAHLVDDRQISVDDTLPILCSWFALPLPQDMQGEVDSSSVHSPDVQKQMLFVALIVLLQKPIDYINKQPNLLLLEDIHWADPTTIEFVAKLSRNERFTQSKSVLISTSREPIFAPLQPTFDTISLGKLTESDSFGFIKALFDDDNLSAQLMDTIVERTDGIPLFIEELVDMLKQNQLVHTVNNVTDFVNKEAIAQVPTSLRDSLQQKLDRLVYAKETVQLAATIGREFDYNLLVAASQRREEQVQIDLEELVNNDLIYLQRKVNGDSYIFKHALVKDAAYESMAKAVLKYFHYNIAINLRSDYGQVNTANAYQIARHFSIAQYWQEAVEMAVLALQHTAKNASYAESLQINQEAQHWLAQLPQEQQSDFEQQLAQLIYSSVMAVHGLGSQELLDLQNQLAKFQQDVEPQVQQDHNQFSAEYMQKWGEFQNLHFQGRVNEAIDLGKTLLSQFDDKNGDDKDNRLEKLMLLNLLGQAYFFASELALAESYCKQTLELYDEQSDIHLWQSYGIEPKSQALFLLSHVQLAQGLCDDAKLSAHESKHWAEKAGCAMSVDGAVFYQALINYHCLDKEQTERLTHSYALAAKEKQPQWLEAAIVCLHEWTQGQYDIIGGVIFESFTQNQPVNAPFGIPILAELMDDFERVQWLCQKTIIAFKQFGHLLTLPLVYRALAVASFKHFGVMNKDININFAKGFNAAYKSDSYWLALDVATHWASCAKQTQWADNAFEKLNFILPKITQGFDTPLYQTALDLSQSDLE